MTNEHITQMEVRHNVNAIQSDSRNLVYYFDEEKQGINIQTDFGIVGLTKKQFKMLAKEAKEIYEMVFN